MPTAQRTMMESVVKKVGEDIAEPFCRIDAVSVASYSIEPVLDQDTKGRATDEAVAEVTVKLVYRIRQRVE